MNQYVRFGFLVVLAGFLAASTTGCANKKTSTKARVSALEAQVNVLTEEMTRLDQSLQEARSAAPIAAAAFESTPGANTGVYRTPSGFELPSINIQKALQNAGYYKGSLDGKVGPGTKEAVKAFQRDNGLDSDGVVGRRTWDKLRAYLAA